MRRSDDIPLEAYDLEETNLLGAVVFTKDYAIVGRVTGVLHKGSEREVVLDAGGDFGLHATVTFPLRELQFWRDGRRNIYGVRKT